MIFKQQVKVCVSMIVSDDTGQLVKFLTALTVLIRLLYTLFNLLHSTVLHVQKISRATWLVMRFGVFNSCYAPG